MFALPTAPAKQSVSETITVLSGRLNSATLLEDRRAAILGLRSFAKDYPATVASGALRSLIGCLGKDAEDVDTVKVVLETLLMLFSHNEDSPEASDEIALWLADEFTQRQENIASLLRLLESSDFYSNLYTLQLLNAILSARTERTEECIFTAPLGISILVGLLEERREALRDEAISLLIYLTPSSTEIQKLVAFESAFERLFSVIEMEGSILGGGRTVEDCLILLANLLRQNPSNQALFRESKCISHLAGLVESVSKPEPDNELATWAQAQMSRNIYALLSVIRLFLVSGSVGLVQNQAAFWKSGLLYHALQLAFYRGVEVQIRAEALFTCADVIRGNADLQGGFAQLTVPNPLATEDQAPHGGVNGTAAVYVIDGLLDLTLGLHSTSEFNLRLGACECLKAYFFAHTDIRLHFLSRAIDGHKAGGGEVTNVLTTLLHPSPQLSTTDPYGMWFAAVIMFHLLYDNPVAKANALAVSEGDVASGEEVVTSIQTMTSHLVSGLSRGDDPRILVGYLMLLLGWLYEDPDGVNDFLGEASHIQSLIQAVVQPGGADELVRGLCATLLGMVYEFSTKDSPIPRATLHPLLVSKLGRDKYLDKLAKLRSHPFMRDYEVIPQRLDPSSHAKLADVYFDGTFVEFFKDNYSRAARSIDRDPDVEIPVLVNGTEKGVSRELVDSLRAEIEERRQAIQEVHGRLETLKLQLEQEREARKHSGDAASMELSKAKGECETLRKAHEDDLRNLRAEEKARDEQHIKQAEETRRRHDEELRQIKMVHQRLEEDHSRQMEQAQRQAKADAERVQMRSEAEIADFRATISRLEVDLVKANKAKTQELQALQETSGEQLAEQTRAAQEALGRLKVSESNLSEEVTKRKEAEASLQETLAAKNDIQAELDDLLMVLGDAEEKSSKYRKRLVELGQEVSDGEDEDGDEADDSGDES